MLPNSRYDENLYPEKGGIAYEQAFTNARGDIHNNTAEWFNAILERARQGVFHNLRKKHLSRYLHEIGFRWNQREPVLKTNKKGQLKLVMKRLPVMTMLRSLSAHPPGRQLRRSINGGIYFPEPT